MTNDNKVADDALIEEDLSILDDTTDWKAKAEEIEQKRREDGIRSRERSKALRDQLAEIKSKETPPDKKDSKPDDALLQRLEKLALKTAGISHADDIELARNTAKKWGMDLEDAIGDEDFKVKLEKLQTARANVEATSGVRGSAGQANSKGKADYWIGKNAPPTDEDVTANRIPRGELGKIARHFMANKGSGKKFYND